MFRVGLLLIVGLMFVAISGNEQADAECGLFSGIRARRSARIEARAQGYGLFGRARASSYGCSGPQQMQYGCSGPQSYAPQVQMQYYQPVQQQYNAPNCENGNCIVPGFGINGGVYNGNSGGGDVPAPYVPISTTQVSTKTKACKCEQCDCVDCECNAFKMDQNDVVLIASTNINPGF